MADEYKCECLDCGHKFTSKAHCTDTKCPECGGDCRRAERPGDGKENRTSFDGEMIRLSTGKANTIELVEDNDELPTYKIKFELMDVGTYNMFNFNEKNLDFMVKEFNEDNNGVVSHGLDHSWKTLEQLGRVYEVVKEGTGKSSKVFALSELYKETEAQKQAHILFKQGLLKFVSGGWFPEKYVWNDETNSIDITNPKLREISSTPMPAKQDAKQKEILQSLNHSPMEESDMTEEIENKEKPSSEGMEVSEHEAKLAALENEYKAKLAEADEMVTAMKAKADADLRVSLTQRAVELGLSEELFKDSTNDAMELALKAAKEVQVSELQKREPENQFGGEGNTTLKDGSPEMIALLEKEYLDWGDIDRSVN